MVPPIRVEVHMLLSKRHNVMTRGAVLLTAALTLSAVTLKAGTDPVTVPERTAIRVTLDQSVATNRSKPGDHFVATVSEPVVINGKTVIPQGARAKGLVVESRESGRLMRRARLRLALQTVDVNGQNYDVRTYSHPRSGRDHKKRNWAWIGGGAAGGAAGVTVALVTGKKDIKLRAETPLRFELAQPVTINVKG